MALLIHRVEILKPQSNCREQVRMAGIWSQRSMKRGSMPTIRLQSVTALFKGEAITLIDPVIRDRHGGLQKHGSFGHIFEQSGS
jgi:hypothetical protein